VFTDTREDAMDRGNGVRASASESLTCYALVRRFIEEHIVGRGDGVMDQDCAVMIAMCDLIDCILACKRGVVRTVEAGAKALKAATMTYMCLVVRVWGTARCRPKFHWLWHIWQQYLRDGRIWDTFALERKHKDSKHLAATTNNLSTFDRTISMRVLLHQRRGLLKYKGRAYLFGPRPSNAMDSVLGCSSVQVSRGMQYHGVSVQTGDIISMGIHFLQVRCCFDDEGAMGVIGTLLEYAEQLSPTCTARRKTTVFAARVGDHDRMRLAHAWTEREDGLVVVVHHRL
jgi:hypothetical protein